MPAMRAEGEQLAFEQFAALLDRRGREIPNGGLVKNWSTASVTVGKSGLRTPIRPDDCHWCTIDEAAVQFPVLRLRRIVSPPIEPWTQMGH